MNSASTIAVKQVTDTGPQKKAVVQPKLMVNAPGDRHEQEADAMAERVMRMSQDTSATMKMTGLIGKSLQRKCAKCEEDEKRKVPGAIMRKPESGSSYPASFSSVSGVAIQRKCAHCDEEERKRVGGLISRKIDSAEFAKSGGIIQRKCAHCEEEEKKHHNKLMRKADNSGGFEAPGSLSASLGSSRGSGSPLPEHTRRFMESAFSADFSDVRIHTNSSAAQMNKEINAKAFTYGNDIYFNTGQYNPGTWSGKSLLAHELTHTIQQSGQTPGVAGKVQRQDDVFDPLSRMIDALRDEDLPAAIAIAQSNLDHRQKDFLLGNDSALWLASRNFGDKSIYELMLALLQDGYRNLYGCLSWMFYEAEEGELEYQRVANIISMHSMVERRAVLFDYQMKVNFQTHFGDREICELVRDYFSGISLLFSLEWMFSEVSAGDLDWSWISQAFSNHSFEQRREVLYDNQMKKRFQTHFDDFYVYLLARYYFAGLGLLKSLEWMFFEADEGEMEVSWLLDVVRMYPPEETKLLYDGTWKVRFQKIFDDDEVALLVDSFDFTLAQKLDWMEYEDTNSNAVRQVIEKASDDEITAVVQDGSLMERLYTELKDGSIMELLWSRARPGTVKAEDFRVMDAVETDTDQNNSIEAIIKKYYSHYNYETGNDRRTIAQAIRELNVGNSCLYYSPHRQSRTRWQRFKRWAKDVVLDRDFKDARANYELIKVRAGCTIKLPSTYYIDMLRDAGQISVRSEWKNTAIDVGRAVEGFIDGLDDGFRDAAVDTVKSILELLRDIFTGQIFKKAYEFFKMLIDKSPSEIWEAIKEYLSGMWESVKAKWETPNTYDRWHFVGSIVGMIIFEVLLALLTFGIGTAVRHSVRVQRFLSKFPRLAKLVDVAMPGRKPDVDVDLDPTEIAMRNRRHAKKLDLDDFEVDNLMKGAGISDVADLLKRTDVLDAELKARDKMIANGQHFISYEKNFDAEVHLPNGHTWENVKDTPVWCRSSKKRGCMLPKTRQLLDPEFDDSQDAIDSFKRQYGRDRDEHKYSDHEDDKGSIMNSRNINPDRKGHSAEVLTGEKMSKDYYRIGKMIRREDADIGQGIDGLWKPKSSRHFDYTVTETKYIDDFAESDRSINSILNLTKRDGIQLSDRWIAGSNRLEKITESAKEARKVRMALLNNRVERLLVIIDRTGKSWVYEVGSDGIVIGLKR